MPASIYMTGDAIEFAKLREDESSYSCKEVILALKGYHIIQEF